MNATATAKVTMKDITVGTRVHAFGQVVTITAITRTRGDRGDYVLTTDEPTVMGASFTRSPNSKLTLA